VLPSKVPNLLLNGSTGIAVGMATNIPPHNLGEICAALLKVLDDPEIKDYQLVANDAVRRARFPYRRAGAEHARRTAGDLQDRPGGHPDARATWEKGPTSARAAQVLYITSIPFWSEQGRAGRGHRRDRRRTKDAAATGREGH